ncbi:hypothetical protein LBMAG42_45210 [Deltaproteobacteria bacterium]|nr:hypothetical protein LBMAG42_45210 [Deltaproteobacteria bacterium]
MLLAHEPDGFDQLRVPTPDDPLRILFSGCLAGQPCGVDGTDYGLGAVLRDWVSLPTVRMFTFCPEDFALGTPRTMPDIHGGDGRAVLAGRARVLDEHGTDLTEKMLAGAAAMLAHARRHAVEVCVLTDSSAACGTQVISDGCRLVAVRKHQRGLGVAAALLHEHGYPVVAQRDFRSIGRLHRLVDPTFVPAPGLLDHHEHDWCRAYFGEAGTR